MVAVEDLAEAGEAEGSADLAAVALGEAVRVEAGNVWRQRLV